MKGLNSKWFYQGGESASAYTVGDFAVMIYELTSNGYSLDLANAYKVGNTYIVKVVGVPQAVQQDIDPIVEQEQSEDEKEENEPSKEPSSEEILDELTQLGQDMGDYDVSTEDKVEESVDTPQVVIYTEEQLREIGENGMSALREIGDKFGVKNVSKDGLIKEILAAQAASI